MVLVAIHRHQMSQVLIVKRVLRFVQLPVLATHFPQHLKSCILRNFELSYEIDSVIALAEAKLLRYRLGHFDFYYMTKDAFSILFYINKLINLHLNLLSQLLVLHARF